MSSITITVQKAGGGAGISYLRIDWLCQVRVGTLFEANLNLFRSSVKNKHRRNPVSPAFILLLKVSIGAMKGGVLGWCLLT